MKTIGGKNLSRRNWGQNGQGYGRKIRVRMEERLIR